METDGSAVNGRRLTIVHVVGPVVAGGMERVVEFLSIGHRRRGHQVVVAAALSPGGNTHPFVEAVTAGGVRVQSVRVTARAYLKELREVRELLRRLSPDVVHTHGYRRNLLHRPTAARLGIPTVTTIHGRDSRGLKGSFYELLQQMNFRRFDAVVAVSRALYDQTRAGGIHADRLYVVRNAWGGSSEPLTREAARLRLGLPHDARVVGWVGRLTRVKGGDILLEAMSHLPEPRPLAVMIGYGPQEERLRRRTKRLGLESVVQFHTDINNAGLYFRAFDTYVLSSRSEGLPIVLFEAMAAGTPIVATRVGGVPEVIGQGEAWLVPSEDPQGLAEAIATSLRDRATAHEFAHRATVRLSTDYALDRFLDKYEAIYYDVVARKAGRPTR